MRLKKKGYPIGVGIVANSPTHPLKWPNRKYLMGVCFLCYTGCYKPKSIGFQGNCYFCPAAPENTVSMISGN